MSKKQPVSQQKLFNIDKESRKYYPESKPHATTKDPGIPAFSFTKGRRVMSNSGLRIISF